MAALSAVPPAAAEHGPHVGEFFEYTFHRHISGGGDDAYYGYSDDTRSQGRYEIVALNDTEGTVSNHYTWTFASNEGDRQSGAETRRVSYTLPDRRYIGPVTDTDDYDFINASQLSLWFWISPNSQVGDRLQLLDGFYTVVSREGSLWVGMTPRTAIELRGGGTGNRNDVYGQFTYEWTDTYFFDAATGFFLQERYIEHDRGTWNGEFATFTLTENVDFTAGSYDPPLHTGAFIAFLLWVGAFFAFIGICVVAYRRRPKTVYVASIGDFSVKVRRLKDLSQLPENADRFDTRQDIRPGSDEARGAKVSPNFGAFVEDFANKALLGGDRVYYAKGREGLAGIAFYNREANIGTILARDTGLAEVLRKEVRASDFFSEWRHKVPEQAIRYAAYKGRVIGQGDAYNLFDTYSVLYLDRFPNSAYDTTLIRRMTAMDLPEVARIAKAVFRVDSEKWIMAQVASGDEGFVARVDGKIVGFGFATFARGAGRLHSLAVLPEFRNRGIGRELVRARLNALSALGAEYVVSEIAKWNLSSMQLAFSHGFREVGEMFVETARRSRVKRDIVRR